MLLSGGYATWRKSISYDRWGTNHQWPLESTWEKRRGCLHPCSSFVLLFLLLLLFIFFHDKVNCEFGRQLAIQFLTKSQCWPTRGRVIYDQPYFECHLATRSTDQVSQWLWQCVAYNTYGSHVLMKEFICAYTQIHWFQSFQKHGCHYHRPRVITESTLLYTPIGILALGSKKEKVKRW